MKRFDSILQNYYMNKLPKYQQRPGTVDEDAIRAYMMQLPGRAPKEVPKRISKGLTQISAKDQFYQNQLQKYGRTREDIERSRQEAALPFLLATGAIGAAAATPLLATVAPAIGAGLSYAPIASAPAATLGNLLSSGFASDFLLNRAPQIPSQIGRGQYGDALANTAFGALDLMGVGAINPNVINNAGRLVNQGRQYLGNTYRNISEGNNIFNYAWRSPARGIDELQARNMYRQLKNQNTLDNATKDLIGEYQYSSGSFTGRFEPAINYARRIQLEDAIDAQRIAQQQNKPTVLVRTFKPTEKELYPINESGRVIMDRPTSWSVGLGAPHSVGDRMVIKLPSGSKGLLNEYNTTKYSQDLAPLSQERELILGSGLNIGKRLGKVKNEFGGYDYIHKFRGYNPTVYDDIRRLNTENIGEIVNLNRNLATSGGFNVGVYPFLKNPNIVLKLGTTGESGMANPNDNIFFTGIPKIARDMPTSMWAMNKFPAKEINLSGLTAQQIGRNTSKPIPNNILGSIMERTNAGSLSDSSFDELANIEPWVYRTAARNINELIRKGIGVDFYGNNILFKSQNNIPEFNFIDLGPLPKSNTGVFPVGPLYALDSKALDQGVRMLDLEALKSIFKQKTRNALYDAAARSGIGSYSDQQIFDAIKKSEASIDEGLSLKKLLSLNNKQDGGPMVNPRGFMDGQPPIGSNWRIPGNTLYNPTPFKIRAVGSNGIEKTLKPFDTKRVSFGNAQYVDEYKMKAGGLLPKAQIGRYITGFHSNLVMPAVNSILGHFQQQPNPVQQPVAPTNQQKPVNYGMGDYYSLYSKYADKVSTGRRENDRIIGDAKSDVRIPLSSGRFRGANVSQNLIKNAVNAAKQYNVDPWLLVSVIGRESAFGEGDQANKVRAGNYRDLLSGWNLAEDFQPYDPLRYLADRRAPGIIVKKTPHGWNYDVTDQKALNEYLKQNVGIYEKYADKLEKTPKLGNLNSLQLAARFLKSHKVGDYNPGDPNYTRMVYEDMKLLKSDPKIKEYMKTLGYKMGGLTPNKAREILHHGEVGGRKLTDKQRRFFGAMSKGHTKKYQLGGNALAMLRDYGGGMSVPPLYKKY